MKLTKNLNLTSVQSISFGEQAQTRGFEFHFNFFGEEAMAIVTEVHSKLINPSFEYVESSEELCDSFYDIIHQEEVWAKLKEAVTQYVENDDCCDL